MVRVLSATIVLGVFAMFGLMVAGSGPGQRHVYAAAVTLSAQQGSPGDQVRVTGSGFDSGRRIRLSWDGRLYLGDTRIDERGAFALAFAVPHDADDGQHTITYHVLGTPPDGGVLIEEASAQTPLFFSVGGPGVNAQPVAQQPAGGAQQPASGAQQPASPAKPPAQRPGVDVGSNRPGICEDLPGGSTSGGRTPAGGAPGSVPEECLPTPYPCVPYPGPGAPPVPPRIPGVPADQQPEYCSTPTPVVQVMPQQVTATPTPPGGSTPTPPGQTQPTPTPPGGSTPTPPGGSTPTPPGGSTPTPPGGTGTPTPPGGTGTPTPPGGTGTPTPPGGTGTPTPPGGTGTPTPPGGTGTPTPPGGTGTPTPPGGTGTPTPPGGTGTPTPPGGTGTPTPPGGTGTPTPPGGTGTPTPPGGTGTPTPPGGSTPTPTPPGQTQPTPTPFGGSTPTSTPPGGPQPTPTVSVLSTPAPTTEVMPGRVTQPTTPSSPQQVAPTPCVYPGPGGTTPGGTRTPPGADECAPQPQRTVVVPPGGQLPVVVPGSTQALPRAGAGQLRTDQGTDWGMAMVMLGVLLTTANLAIMVRRRRLDS